MVQDKICVHPWSHLNINPNGDVWPCCHQRGKNIYVLGNMHEKTIEEIYNAEPMRKLRTQMMQGILPEDVCGKCIEYEKLNMYSPRMEANRQVYAPEVMQQISNTNANGSVKDYKIRYWDLRWSNKCNMACIMCDPDWSSLWTQQIKTNLENFTDDTIQSETILRRFKAKAKQKVLHVPNNGWIDQHIEHVEFIYFAGGEPLIMDEHWYILDKLHKLKKHSVRLKYNTNMSKLEHFGKNAIDYWKHWQPGKLSVEGSIDETGTRAEYIRYGTNWQQVENNIKTLVEAGIKTQANASIGCYNVMRLPELLEELWELYKPKKPNSNVKINLNPVLNGWCRCEVLPDEWKQNVKQKLIKLQNSNTIPITRMEKILYELERPHKPESVDWLFKQISFLDLNKHTTLLKAIPEMSKLNDMYGGLYEKYKNEWIKKSVDKRNSGVDSNLCSSIHN